jgi:hypothetical protein
VLHTIQSSTSRSLEKPSAPFLKYGTQKCASDASAVLADDPTPRVWLDG